MSTKREIDEIAVEIVEAVFRRQNYEFPSRNDIEDLCCVISPILVKHLEAEYGRGYGYGLGDGRREEESARNNEWKL